MPALSVSLGLTFAFFAVVRAAPPTPHIVFVIVDDMGYNDAGFHATGSEIETPNLDALAGEGVKLENYYVAPLCTPTRSQLLSGRYLTQNGMQHLTIKAFQPRCLPLTDATLADQLTAAGYSSHMIGKWHLGLYQKDCWPTERGFQSFFGLLLGSGDHYSYNHTETGNGAGKCGWDFEGMDLRDDETDVQSTYDGQYSTDIFTDRAKTIIEDQDPDVPMFMYLSYTAPHLPLQVNDSYADYYKGKIGSSNRRTYAGMVTYMDEKVGEVVQTLKDEGLWDNTVFIFSTDNGGIGKKNAGNNWPLRGAKGNYFEGGIRALGFVDSPLLSSSVRGTSSYELMHITDWFPTLVEGVAESTAQTSGLSLDGINLWDIIKDGTAGDPDRVLIYNIDPEMQRPTADAKYDSYSSIFNVTTHAAIRRGDMKLITGYQENSGYWWAPNESGLSDTTVSEPDSKVVWLFNITADPTEENDLSDDPAWNDEVEELLELLADHEATATTPDVQRRDCDADPALHGGLWTCWDTC